MRGLGSYEDWKHCITVLCGIPLTPEFVERRLADLRDGTSHGTRQFVKSWGEAHLRRTVGWFERAKRELEG